jgi:hypothetical protein
MGVSAYRRIGVSACGRVGVWAYGRMGVWAYGRAGLEGGPCSSRKNKKAYALGATRRYTYTPTSRYPKTCSPEPGDKSPGRVSI